MKQSWQHIRDQFRYNPRYVWCRWGQPLLWGAIAIFLILSAAQAQSFSIELGKQKVVANERFAVRFVLSGIQGKPDFPNFGGLEVVSGPSVVSNMQIINGQVSQSVSYDFYLRAPQKGSYTIGPAQLIFRGKAFKTRPVKITASKSPPVPDAGALAGNEIFVIPRLSTESAFVGQRVTVTYELFTTKSIRDFDLAENPIFDGFGVEMSRNLAQLPRETTQNGVTYKVVNIRQFHLFPQQAGTLEIPTLTFRGLISQNANSNDPFARFGFTRREPIVVSSAAQKLRVKPWPANPPASFSGLVGDFKLMTSLAKKNLRTGETATLRVHLQGEGNIKLQGAPTLSLPSSFDVFDPSPREAVRPTFEAVNAEKVFDFLIAPREPGTFALDSVEISYLDPKAGVYKRLSGGLDTVKVSGKALTSKVTLPETEVDQTPGIQKGTPSFVSQIGWSWLGIAVVPWLLLGLSTFFIRKRAAALLTPEAIQARKLAFAKKQLAEAKVFLDTGDARNFYQTLNRTFWAFLGDVFQMPASQYQRENLQAAWKEKGLTEDTQKAVLTLLAESEMGAYAPGAVTPPAETYDHALNLIQTIHDAIN